MKRITSFLVVPVLLITIAMSLSLSPATARTQLVPDNDDCMPDAAQQMAACMQAAADSAQREQCRDYFECLREVCAALRKGEHHKACKPPFAF